MLLYFKKTLLFCFFLIIIIIFISYRGFSAMNWFMGNPSLSEELKRIYHSKLKVDSWLFHITRSDCRCSQTTLRLQSPFLFSTKNNSFLVVEWLQALLKQFAKKLKLVSYPRGFKRWYICLGTQTVSPN